jgi:hypothetical protein
VGYVAIDPPPRQRYPAAMTPAGDQHYQTTEPTTFNLDLILFYVSCTVFATAVAVALVALILFSHRLPAVVIGVLASITALVSAITMWIFLRRARREHHARG